MSTLTSFTTYAEIRAVLGVSDKELEDVTLALPIYHDQLLLQCGDISDDLVTTYEMVSAIAQAERTPAQAKFYSIFRLFSAYQVATNLLGSLALFSPQRITDGKAEIERADLYAEIKTHIPAMLATLAKRLKEALAALDPAYVPPATPVRNFILGTGLASDPVTST